MKRLTKCPYTKKPPEPGKVPGCAPLSLLKVLVRSCSLDNN